MTNATSLDASTFFGGGIRGDIRIQTDIQYNPQTWELTVLVKQAECPFSMKKVYWQVHCTLLPHMNQR